MSLSFTEIIRNKQVFSQLLKDSITDTMSKIKYELPESKIRKRIERIYNLVTNEPIVYNELLELFILMLKKHEQYE